ncbi:GD15049 [Drosophila simulans]|uniref:Protein maelstrom n=1 Tax=Drosophila simulans TaxID=7240 RepID=MAEL_DROSI|nr:RecName: Full=Protein maelstrom [Drosophila simulans]EDX11517.1 GD15049 [Drosophila simulans]
MAPKKQNGFMMFVNEWRNRNAEGRRMTLAEAVYHCGTIWEKMDTQQRGPYNSDAKDANAARRDKRGSLNGHGQVDKAQREAAESLMDKAQREAAESLMDMKRTTERLVLNAKMSHDLENAKFVFVAFNYFTKALTTDVYVPAEFAACEYSLKEGIRSIYSTMIDPGQIIFGQGSDALHNSSTTHDLPLPPNALGEKNMVKLYRNILDYLTKCQGEGKTPIVFTPAENIGMVKSCFRYLECEDDSRDGGGKIEVFDIQYLLFILKKEVMSVAGLNDEKINKFATDAFFKNDFFEFTAGIACQISSINTRDYHVATLIGLLPAQTINVYLGSTLRSMHEVLSDNDTKLTGYISFLFEVICGVALMFWVLQKARKELSETLLSADYNNEGKHPDVQV